MENGIYCAEKKRCQGHVPQHVCRSRKNTAQGAKVKNSSVGGNRKYQGTLQLPTAGPPELWRKRRNRIPRPDGVMPQIFH